MSHRATVMERAFELARSGRPRGTTDIIAALRREGYSTEQIQGPALKRQLVTLIKATRSDPAARSSSLVDQGARTNEN
jgi:hypothetical protein